MKQTQATAILYRRSIRRPASKGLPIGNQPDPSLVVPAAVPKDNRRLSARQIGIFLAAPVILALLIALGVASRHVVARYEVLAGNANRSEEGIRLNDRARQQLEADLSDSGLAADIATLKTYQKALTDELKATDEKLKSDPHDPTFLKRKQLIQVLLTNTGGTGVNDQLAAIEAVQQMVASQAVSTQAEEATARRVIANLRMSAESWRIGAFANAGKLAGLHWENEQGLTRSTPYMWGASGWETDRVGAGASTKR